MIAGDLNQKINILSHNITVNEVGEQIEKYETKSPTCAKVIFNNGARAIENNEVVFNSNVKFEIRIYHKISALDIIQYRADKYRILNITKDFQNQKIIIDAEKINE